ncbi:MAG TPA: helix-turn-helix domain-containing protein [Candidatus Thermoplasmatota archaeon]|nr:helix-turn-helix domain-containing protein [Candidatus Thermoplasmatota archaeon]
MLEWSWLPALGLFAMYNRVRPEGSFENGTRRRIFDVVRARPGQSIAEISSAVGVSHSTASYHLDRLLEFNLLASTPDGNKTRFFVNGGTFTEEERRVLTAITNAETRRVLATIVANPGCYRAELTLLLAVSSPTVNWHLARLLAAGLVREERRGRNRYLFADPGRLRALLGTLAQKTEGTDYDGAGIRDLLRVCGG